MNQKFANKKIWKYVYYINFSEFIQVNELNQAKKKCAELEKAHSIEVSLNNDYIHKLAKKKKKIVTNFIFKNNNNLL